MNFFRHPVIVGTLPITLANGTTADATQVMSDLNWIVNQVNANAAPLSGVALLAAANTFTQVQSGVSATQPANFPIASQVQSRAFSTLSSTLGTNTLTARIAALPLPAYAAGQIFTFFPSQQNTGPASLNVDGLGSAIIFSMGSTLIGGELVPTIPAVVAHDGVKFNLVSQRKIGTVVTNSLTSSVALATTGSYFTGPSVNVGGVGTWLITGTATLTDTAGAAAFFGKLMDNANLIASARGDIASASQAIPMALSGVITNPTGPISFLVRDVTSASGSILSNAGNVKDSTITAVRIG